MVQSEGVDFLALVGLSTAALPVQGFPWQRQRVENRSQGGQMPPLLSKVPSTDHHLPAVVPDGIPRLFETSQRHHGGSGHRGTQGTP